MQDRTTMMIAHRHTTISQADTIVVLDQGKIIQQGAPPQLSADEGGAFRQLMAH